VVSAPIIEYRSVPTKYVNAVPIIDRHAVFTNNGVAVTLEVIVTVGVVVGVVVEVTAGADVALGVVVLVGVIVGVAVMVGVIVGVLVAVDVTVGVGVAGGVLLHDCTSTVATISGTAPLNTLDMPVDRSVVSASLFASTVP